MSYKNSFPFILYICVVLITSCKNAKNENFQVKGKLSNSSGEFISLVNVNTAKVVIIDSVKMDENGEFIFTKKVPEKGFYSIRISTTNYATIIADSSEKIILEGDAKNLNEISKITGSIDSKIFYDFSTSTKQKFKAMELVRTKQDSIRRVFEAYMNTTSDSLILDSLSKNLEPTFNVYSNTYRKLAADATTYIKKFIDDNTNSFASLAAVQMLNPDRDIIYFIKVADALSVKYPSIKTMQEFKHYIDTKKQLALGMTAPEINMNDRNGNAISLSSLKGKIVLIDFWASWCKPCRASNPFVVSLYDKYKSKGLEIYSVSLDFNKSAWLKAINQDKLNWENHVCDMKQWQSPVVAQYGFSGIPFSCLLDREGKIIGKNLQGSELEEKIIEVLQIF
jgi:thiol-disulfide isomerase/thioredoxin